MNSLGSVGSTFGFVVSAMNFSYNGACAINLILFVISIPGLAWVVFTKVADTTHGTNISGDVRFSGTESEDGRAQETQEDFAETKVGVRSSAVPL
jgi:hypothetical protein